MLTSACSATFLHQRVKISGIESNPEYNGRFGTAVEYLPSKERYVVHLEGSGEAMCVSPAEMRSVCKHCGTASSTVDTTMSCGVCFAQWYCTAEQSNTDLEIDDASLIAKLKQGGAGGKPRPEDVQQVLHRRERLLATGLLEEASSIEPREGCEFMFYNHAQKAGGPPRFKDGGAPSGTLYHGDGVSFPGEGLLRTTASRIARGSAAAQSVDDRMSVALWCRVRLLREMAQRNVRGPHVGTDFEYIKPKISLIVCTSSARKRPRASPAIAFCASESAVATTSGADPPCVPDRKDKTLVQVRDDEIQALRAQVHAAHQKIDSLTQIVAVLQDQVAELIKRIPPDPAIVDSARELVVAVVASGQSGSDNQEP